MATEQEKALYGCIAVVEDAAKGLKTLQEAVREAIETEARQSIGYEAQNANREILGASRELVRELKEAADIARASGRELRRAGLMQGVFLVGVAVIVFGLGYLILEHFYTPYKKAELRELNAQITEAQGTLASLESKTWRLELVQYKDGQRGIVLPKGVKMERATKVKDGREIILITP